MSEAPRRRRSGKGRARGGSRRPPRARRAPLDRELRARPLETETLLAVSEAVGTTLDVTEALRRVSREAARALGADMVGALLADPARTVLQPVAGYHVPAHRRDALGGFPVPIAGHRFIEAAWIGKTPVASSDAGTDARIAPEMRAIFQPRSLLFGPMVVKGEPIGGLLAVWWRRRHQITAADLRLVEAVGRQAGLLVDNARLHADGERRRREAETFAEVTRVLNASLDLGTVLPRIAESGRDLCGADMAWIALRERESGRLVYRHWIGARHTDYDRYSVEAGKGAGGQVLLTGRPFRSDNYLEDPRISPDYAALARAEGIVAQIVVPIRIGERIEGLLYVDNRSPQPFTDRDEAILTRLAEHAAAAIQNARLFEALGERLRETETLMAVGQVLSRNLDLHALLRHFLRHVARTIRADSVGVWLLEPVSGTFEPFAGYRIPPERLGALRSLRIDPAESAFYAEGVESRRVLLSADAPGDPRIPESLKRIAPHRAQLFGPIVAKDRVVGAFIAVWWDRVPEFSEGELALVGAMGSHAGVALENARLFQEHQRKLEELAVLYEVSRAVTGQLDVDRLVLTIHEQVSRVLDTANMVLLLYDGERRQFEVALRMYGGRPDPNPVRRYPLGTGLMSRVVERGQPIRTADYAAACRAEGVEPVKTSASLPHWLGVPMIAGEECFGVIALREAAKSFTEADERLLANIAGVAALALRSARLFAEKTRAHDDLRAAQDQLVRSERLRAVGEMAAGVAHDFNNVLAAIMGRAQLLLSQVEEPAHRRQLQIVEQAAIDGARTVRRIQEFTRMRRARPFEPVDLNDLMEEVVEVTRSRWKDEALGKGVDYEVRVERTPVPIVAGDPSELREVLINLILNALDAMPDGGQIVLRSGVEGDQVFCTVTDTGIGMTEEVRQRVFDPFFTTKAEKGTGLGLSVAYGIIARHGGAIEVRSEPWRGSTFTLRLPPARGRPRTPPPAAAAVPDRRARILVIDDEENVRQVLADMLVAQGHAVVACADGRAGLSRLHEEPFDLVFTDLGLPGLSGWEVTRLVKMRRPETPVVLVTGWGDQIELADALRRGVSYVLPKPFDVEEIRATVREALSRPHLAIDHQ
jgi:signal transduction histidine kinase/ActR/RegA family two-component response regulator/putative methionine-R-sulfoxide reductase with GAF domain